MNPMFWQLLLQISLISLNAVFACAEIAVLSINDAKVARLAAAGDKRAERLSKLTYQPARFLATIQVAITLAGFLGSAFAADNFSKPLVNWLIGLGVGISAETLSTFSVIFITLILSYFTLVFGELVPKRMAMKKAEKIALALSGLISFISKFFAPLVSLLTASTNGILRLFGIDPNSADGEISEEEILMMVDAGRDSGVIDFDEQEFIQKIFEFDDTTVGEIVTHRTDVSILWSEDSPETWIETIRETHHSHYPVCDDTVDNVVGILKARDFLLLDDKSYENVIMSAIKPAYFVTEGVYADVLFRQMKTVRNHFSVVLDEYGGMLGVVTMNDLLELLVGDLDDCALCDMQPVEIERLDPSTWIIRGTASLDEVSEALGVTLPLEEYETFGGYVFGTYGSVPDDGIEFELNAGTLHIKVAEIRAHRIEKAIVSINKSE